MSLNLTQSASNLAKTVHAVLASNAHMQLILGNPPRLYDSAPEDPVFPYLTYGAMRSVDISADDTPLFSHQITLHIWSRYEGRAEVFESLNYVSRALELPALNAHSDMAIITANPIYSDVLRAADGRTMNGLLRMSFTAQPQTQIIET